MTENKLEVQGINSKGFGTIAKLVMQDRNLSCPAKAVYAYFCSYAGGGDTCFPTRKKICYDLRISNDSLSKYLNELIKSAYISCVQVKENGKFSHNIYTINAKIPCPKISDTENSVYGKVDTNNNSNKINSIPNNNNKNNNKSEAQAPAQAPDTYIIDLPTNKFNTQNENYYVTVDFYNTMKELYPSVSVINELRSMKAWLITNTKKRKTLQGMEKFINSWLSRQQNNNNTYSQRNNNYSKQPEQSSNIFLDIAREGGIL